MSCFLQEDHQDFNKATSANPSEQYYTLMSKHSILVPMYVCGWGAILI